MIIVLKHHKITLNKIIEYRSDDTHASQTLSHYSSLIRKLN